MVGGGWCMVLVVVLVLGGVAGADGCECGNCFPNHVAGLAG